MIYLLLSVAALGCGLAAYLLWPRQANKPAKPGALRAAIRSLKLPARLQAP